MAIAYRTVDLTLDSHNNLPANATTAFDIREPTNLAVGDQVLVIMIGEGVTSANGNPTNSTDATWTQLFTSTVQSGSASHHTIAIWLSDELTSADVTQMNANGLEVRWRNDHATGVRDVTCIAIPCTGIDTTTPQDITFTTGYTSSGTTVSIAGGTTVTDGCVIVHIVGSDNQSGADFLTADTSPDFTDFVDSWVSVPPDLSPASGNSSEDFGVPQPGLRGHGLQPDTGA